MTLRMILSWLIAFVLAAVLDPARGSAQNAYVTNYGSSTVSVVDTSTNTVTATIFVAPNPYAVAVSPRDNRAYITNPGSVEVIDTSRNIVLTTILVGSGATWNMSQRCRLYRHSGDPNGSRVYVGNRGLNSVSVINTKNMAITTIPVGAFPLGIAVAPNDRTSI
jgi:YVTN family beta-propeller protein